MQLSEQCIKGLQHDFDLLKLQHNGDRTIQSWIYASGEGLSGTLQYLLSNEAQESVVESLKLTGMACGRGKSKTLIYMKNLLGSIQEGKPVKWCPLVLLVYLAEKSGCDRDRIILNIDKLGVIKNNSEFVEINAIKKLDTKIAKLLGIHAADGSISNYDGQIWIKDGNYNNLIFVKNLFNEIFGFTPKVVKLKNANAWGLYVNNKVIQRYFVEFFEFKRGYKTDSVKMPEIIKALGLEIKNAFVSGVLMSDGSVGFDGKIRLNCKSKCLVEDVHDVLLENDLRISSLRNSIHDKKSTWYFSSPAPVNLTENEKYKWLEFFDVGSEKWYKVKETIFGNFEGKIDNYEGALEIFAQTYIGGSNSKIRLVDVIKAVKTLDVIEQKRLSQILHTGISTSSKYVRLLRNANILMISEKRKSRGVGKGSSPSVYLFNKNVSEWKVPYRLA